MPRRKKKTQAAKAVKTTVVQTVVQKKEKPAHQNARERRTEQRSHMAPQARDRPATDGLNHGVVLVNNSSLADKFSYRRDKVTDIFSATPFNSYSRTYYLNPGNTSLFPVFSQIAATYEMYRVVKMRLVYEPRMMTSSGTTVSSGKVVLVTNFDPDDTPFSNSTQCENYAGSVAGPAYEKMSHDVLRASKKSYNQKSDVKYVSLGSNTVSPVANQGKFYDVGAFTIWVENTPGTALDLIGELFIEYQFVMMRAKMQTPMGANLKYGHYNTTSPNASTGSNALGTVPLSFKPGSTLELVQSTSALNVFGLNAIGRFMITILWNTGNTITSAPAVAFAGATNGIFSIPGIVNGSSATASTFYTANTAQYTFWVDITIATTSSATLGGCVSVTAPGSLAGAHVDIYISQISSGVTSLPPSLTTSTDLQSVLERLARLERPQLLGDDAGSATPFEEIKQELHDVDRVSGAGPRTTLSTFFGLRK